jgi:hypothetical protein
MLFPNFTPYYIVTMAESRNSGTRRGALGRQRRRKYISEPTNKHKTVEEWLEVVSSEWSVPKLYNESQQEKLVSRRS